MERTETRVASKGNRGGVKKSTRGAKRGGRAAGGARTTAAQKAAATRGAAEKARETKRFADAAAKRYGRNSQTAKNLKEYEREARRHELEARNAKSLSAKKKARAAAGRTRQAAANAFRTATSQPTRGQAKQRGWVEVKAPKGGPDAADTFTAYEHARYGAGSVLSLLESRPGIVGIRGWRRVSQIERRTTGLTRSGKLSTATKERADDVAKDLGMNERQRAELYELLLEAELYGVEIELDVENYQESAR